jgi:acyl-CoA reductase-like NAD-dependent aldehyde dehydrogenase
MPTGVIGQSSYVAGTFRVASGDGIDVMNPSTEDVLATVISATVAGAAAASAAANEARTGWARPPSTARGGYLRQMADLIDAHRDELAKLLVLEVDLLPALGHTPCAGAWLGHGSSASPLARLPER